MEITRLDRLARMGYFARAVVYGLFGYLALTTSSLARKGPTGEFEMLRDLPGGRIILLVLAAGLLAYGVYKLLSALLDVDRKGTKAKGAAERIGAAIGGLAYLSMCWVAVRIVAGFGAESGQGGGKEAAGTALQMPLGSLALALAGVGFLAAAAVQLRSAFTKHFMRWLSSDAPPLTCTVGRVGLAARSIVFAVVGWSLVRGALRGDEDEVQDLGSALAGLRDNELLYLAVAAGLIVFAIYSAVEARYRIVPRIDPVEAGKRAVEQHV